MRLVDADTIAKRMMMFCDKNCPYTLKARDVMCVACFMGMAMELLEDAPTIEPERKTGQWLQISPAGIYECSECAQTVMTEDIGCYKYCHGCGAYMGGDEGV